MLRSLVVCGALVVLVGTSAAAQTGSERIPLVAADVRVPIARFKADPAVATNVGVAADDLPTRGLGFVAGAHIYPVRTRRITFGLGVEMLRTRARRTREPTTAGGQAGPTVETHLSAFSPQLSFNFGHRDGWSYISGGLGSATLATEAPLTTGVVEAGASGRKTINYGGGARWFVKQHLAVSLDLRFYAVSPLVGTTEARGYPRMTVMVFSGGVAFR